MPAKLIVAYRTRLVPALIPSVDEFDPPANYKKPEAIAAWRDSKVASLQEECSQQPYTATFEEVWISDTNSKEVLRFTYYPPESGRKCIALRAKSELLKRYPDAWPHTSYPVDRRPKAVFIGFNPRLFLKIMGVDCSLPVNKVGADGKPDPDRLGVLPLSMWLPNSDHRDITEAVMPRDFSALTWSTVLRARGLQEKYKTWLAPGRNVEMDLSLALTLATQLGLLANDD